MNEDERIVATANRWETMRHFEATQAREEASRRYDAILRILRLVLATGGLLVVAWVGFSTYRGVRQEERELAQEADRTARLRDEEHTRAYQACLHAGIGDACACLWDTEACRPQAATQCRERLPADVCACLDDVTFCAAPAYQACLLKMSETDCRCLVDAGLCAGSEED